MTPENAKLVDLIRNSRPLAMDKKYVDITSLEKAACDQYYNTVHEFALAVTTTPIDQREFTFACLRS